MLPRWVGGLLGGGKVEASRLWIEFAASVCRLHPADTPQDSRPRRETTHMREPSWGGEDMVGRSLLSGDRKGKAQRAAFH